VLGVELVAAQLLVAGVTEISGAPVSPTPMPTLYVALSAASVTVSAALEGVVDAALACTPALELRPTLRADRVWFAASVKMCNVASGWPPKFNVDVKDPLPLATVAAVGCVGTLTAALWFASALAFAQTEINGVADDCVVLGAAPLMLLAEPVQAKAVPEMPRAKAVPAITMAVRGNCIGTPLIAKGRGDLSLTPSAFAVACHAKSLIGGSFYDLSQESNRACPESGVTPERYGRMDFAVDVGFFRTPPTAFEPVICEIGPTPGIVGRTGKSVVVVVVDVDVDVEGATVVVVEGEVMPRIFNVCGRRPVWVNAFFAGIRI
jgi:hypothetical protein